MMLCPSESERNHLGYVAATYQITELEALAMIGGADQKQLCYVAAMAYSRNIPLAFIAERISSGDRGTECKADIVKGYLPGTSRARREAHASGVDCRIYRTFKDGKDFVGWKPI